MGKKSQISIFIIIGIILIVVTGFLIYNSEFDIFVSHDTKLKNQVSTIVKDCIYKNANTGAFLLGQQGGYIYIPNLISKDPTKHIDFGVKIPNWDTKEDNIPSISSMETQLDEYVKSESYSCIQNNLNALNDVFDIKTEDELQVFTTINDNNIIVETNYPIKFNEKNSEEVLTVKDYVVELENLRLGDLYKLANSIYYTESVDNVFENLVIEQIHTANDYSSDKSIPTEGMIISCGKRVWTYPQLKENLANMNNNNFRYLQFEGTYPKNENFKDMLDIENNNKDYLLQYFDKIYKKPLYNTKSSFKNYNVDIFMPTTSVNNRHDYFNKYPYREFEVTPSNGEIVESMDMEINLGAEIPIPCIQVFHHLYDLDYDLIIQLTDKTEENNNFIFQFPLRIEIYNNQAKTKPVELLTEEPSTFNSQNYCNNQSYQFPLMILTEDLEGNPIKNVNISYKCLNIKCDMGSTQLPTFMGVERKYATPQLVTEFPYCIGGYVIGEKNGYHTAKKRVNTDNSLLNRESFVGDNLVELEMIPKKIFPINDPSNFLVIHKEDGTGKRVITENDGYILINIENDKFDFESTAMWPNDNIMNKLEFLEMEGVKYNLTSYYMDSNNELKGILSIENWKPNINKGNNIQFIIPASKNVIDEDNYVTFYDYVKEKSKEDKYEPRIY